MNKLLRQPYNILPSSSPYMCRLIPSLLSPSECASYLSPAVLAGFKPAINNYPTYYRNNDRQVIDDLGLSKMLYDRIKRFLP